jgi:hypothetical protein
LQGPEPRNKSGGPTSWRRRKKEKTPNDLAIDKTDGAETISPMPEISVKKEVSPSPEIRSQEIEQISPSSEPKDNATREELVPKRSILLKKSSPQIKIEEDTESTPGPVAQRPPCLKQSQRDLKKEPHEEHFIELLKTD